MERCSTQYTHVVVDVGAWPSCNMHNHIDSWIERARSYPLSLVIRNQDGFLNPVYSTVDLITSHQWKSITLDTGYKNILWILRELESSNLEMLEELFSPDPLLFRNIIPRCPEICAKA